MSSYLLHFACGIVFGVFYAGCLFQVIPNARGMVVDRTLTQGWRGVNVVVAVLEKIDASNVFQQSESDWFRRNRDGAKFFLRIMAYVRSEDGRRTTTSGGIWGVTLNEFSEATSRVMSNERLKQEIYNSSLIQVDWIEDIVYENMSIPLYSGLAVMLRLDKLFQDNTGLQFGEDLWCMYFNGDQHDWRNAKNNLNNQEGKLADSDEFAIICCNTFTQIANLKVTLYLSLILQTVFHRKTWKMQSV